MEKHLTSREEMEIGFCLSKEPAFFSSAEQEITYLGDLDHKSNQFFNNF